MIVLLSCKYVRWALILILSILMLCFTGAFLRFDLVACGARFWNELSRYMTSKDRLCPSGIHINMCD